MGGTGAIGLPVTLALAKEGHDVYALIRPATLKRNPESVQTLEKAGIKLVEGDIGERESLDSAFEKLNPIQIVVSTGGRALGSS